MDSQLYNRNVSDNNNMSKYNESSNIILKNILGVGIGLKYLAKQLDNKLLQITLPHPAKVML